MGRPGGGGGGHMGGGSHSMGGGHVGGTHHMGGGGHTGGGFGGGHTGGGHTGGFGGGGHTGGFGGGGGGHMGGFGGGPHPGGGNPGGGPHPGGPAGGPHPGGPAGGPHYGGPMGGPGHQPPPPRGPRRSGGGIAVIVVLAVFLFMALSLWGCVSCVDCIGTSATTSTSTSGQTQTVSHEREKLDSGNGFMNDCVVDELGWFDNVTSVETGLEDFWEDTGVQPYVYLKAYDADITDDNAQDWAENYYTENFDREDIFLYIYFAAEDSDNDFGTSVYINGRQVSSVMDSEAIEIFWNNLDENWYNSGLSMDDVILNTFNSTAATIMKTDVKKSTADAWKWFFIVLSIILAGALIISIIVITNKRKHQKAEEDAKILNTPLEEIDGTEDLVKKYTDDTNDTK